MFAAIKAISYYLPENEVNNEELSKRFPEWTVEKITEKIGIEKRYHSGKEETAADMGVKSAEKLFEEHKINRDEIDFLLFCTQSPDYFLPTSACLIQNRLGLRKEIGALDFNLGCSGYIYGLSLAKGLIETKQAKNVLLITSETYSKYIDENDKGNLALFGDASSATLISPADEGAIEHFIFGTDGKGRDNLIVEAGAARTGFNKNLTDAAKNHLYMNGAEIFTFTLVNVPKVVNAVLEKAGLDIDGIDMFIYHQANQFMLESLRKKSKIQENKFYYYLKDVGNTVSSTIPIALYNAIKSGSVKKNDRIMLVGFGVGYSWSGCTIKL